MKILVTGSSGMIGSELVDLLEQSGHIVIGMDRELPQYVIPKNFIKADLLNPIEGGEVLNDVDVIVHLAANARVWELVESPELALENIKTTHNVFEFARKNGIKKILFASSREVYGNNNDLPVSEHVGSQRKTESVYAASKLLGEGYVWAYLRSYGMDPKIVRFSNVYGKYDFSDRFIPKVITQLQQDKPVEIYDRRKVLDFTYITDAAEGAKFLIENWDMADRETNIAYGAALSLELVASMLKDKLNSKSEIVFGNAHPGEVLEYEADITRARSMGWAPRVSIDAGLDKAIKYYTHAA